MKFLKLNVADSAKVIVWCNVYIDKISFACTIPLIRWFTCSERKYKTKIENLSEFWDGLTDYYKTLQKLEIFHSHWAVISV